MVAVVSSILFLERRVMNSSFGKSLALTNNNDISLLLQHAGTKLRLFANYKDTEKLNKLMLPEGVSPE